MADLRVEVADGVATLTMDRPAALNALTIGLKEELLAAFESIAAERAVRSVVLTGAGRAFCAGQDLQERLQPDPTPLAEELAVRYNPLVRAMRTLEKPIVAAVNGVAAGAGASLAFACDIRLAAETASFVLAFGRIGLVPDTGATWLLPRLIGAGRAADLVLVGQPVDARRALEIGLVSRVVAADAVVSEAQALASRLAAAAPRALALSKRALEAAWANDLEAQLELEAELQGEAGATADHREGLGAFVEKRSPKFTGE